MWVNSRGELGRGGGPGGGKYGVQVVSLKYDIFTAPLFKKECLKYLRIKCVVEEKVLIKTDLETSSFLCRIFLKIKKFLFLPFF